jgi:hypothetical protein
VIYKGKGVLERGRGPAEGRNEALILPFPVHTYLTQPSRLELIREEVPPVCTEYLMRYR